MPVSKFVLTVRGGKRGLLVITRNLCRHKQFSRLELTGQNGAQLVKKKLRVRNTLQEEQAPPPRPPPRGGLTFPSRG